MRLSEYANLHISDRGDESFTFLRESTRNAKPIVILENQFPIRLLYVGANMSSTRKINELSAHQVTGFQRIDIFELRTVARLYRERPHI